MKLNIVPARSGIQWVKLGVQTFMKQPLGLTGLAFMYGALYALLGSLGLPGLLALAVLTPAATLAMFVATERVASGSFPMPVVFLAAFRNGKATTRQMLVLGVLHVVALALIIGLLTLLFEGQAMEVTQGSAGTPPQVKLKPAFFIASALQLPLLVLFAFAPALVYWHGVSAGKSLFFSLIAFWRNLRAFVTYAAAWVLILSLLVLLLSLVSGGRPMLLLQFLAPFTLVFLAMMFTSMYFAFRDSFLDSPEDDQRPAAAGEERSP